ncbi:MAG TPA: hypothetical protein VFZ61_07805 [Polyangiales bacterium]
MRTAGLLACCTLLALGLSLCLWIAGAAAQQTARAPDEEARRHYERGLSLYEDGAYDAALGELIRAYELRPAPILLYNIALVHRALNDHAAALSAFRQYVTVSGKSLPEARRAEVDAQILELEQRVAQVTIQVDVPDAEILIDHRLVGQSPLSDPLLVNAGMRQLTVQHPSFSPQNRQLRLAGGDRVEQVFRLSAAPALSPGETSTHSAEPDAKKRKLRGLVIGWGITGALAVSALGCGISALMHDRDLADARESLAPDTDALQADADKTRRLAIATDVLSVAALGAGAVSLWWTLRRPAARSERRAANQPGRGRERDAQAQPESQRASLELRLGPSQIALRARY